MITLGYALALLIGLALGILGGGGSILTIPVLHYVMDYPIKMAVPMSLVVVGVCSGVGSIAHWRGGTLSIRTVVAFGPTAIVGSLLGAELGLRVSAGVQLAVFGVVVLVAAAWMYFGAALLSLFKGAGTPKTVQQRRPVPFITLSGALVGLLTGFVGVGGGFLYVPTLVLFAGLEMQHAVGTSLALIMLSCVAGALRYQGSMNLDWNAIALFTGIALVGIVIGSRLGRRVPQAALRRGFAAFLLLMGASVLLLGR